MENPRKQSISQRGTAKKDILRNAVGDYDILRNAEGDIDDAPIVIDKAIIAPTTKKISFAGTTDKMGLTTDGSLTRTFFWGVVLGAAAIVALGFWKDKINLSYSK